MVLVLSLSKDRPTQKSSQRKRARRFRQALISSVAQDDQCDSFFQTLR